MPVRDRIVAASYQCFDEYGIEKTGIEDIASKANITRRTVYKYFPNKEHIIAEISAIESAKIDAKIRRLMERPEPIAETLTECVFVAARLVEKAPFLRGVAESARITSLAADPVSDLHRAQLHRWRPVLEPAMKAGDIASDLTLDDIVSWLTLANHILLIRLRAVHSTVAELKRFIRAFIVEPLLVTPETPVRRPLAEGARNAIRTPGAPLSPASASGALSLASALGDASPLEQQIISAAEECFIRGGVRKTTFSDIAGHAQLSRRTLYRYFANKEDILARIAIWQTHQVNQEIRARVNRFQDFESIVADCLLLAVRIVEENPQIKLFADGGLAAGRPVDPGAPDHKVIREQWASLLDAAAERGKFAPGLSVDDVVSWLYLAQALLHTKVDAIASSDDELRHFIRRFIVQPVMAPDQASRVRRRPAARIG